MAANFPNIDTIHSRRRSAGEYRFCVGDLETEITVRLFERIDGDGYDFEISHAIHTPTQGSPYRTSRAWGDTADYALSQAVTGITMHYEIAVKAGHTPEEAWLVRW